MRFRNLDSGSGNREPYRRVCIYSVSLFLAVAVCLSPFCEDWPTYQHDNQRSGITSEQPDPPLNCNWVLAPKQPPRPAWAGSPAKQDFWHGFSNLKPRVLFDRANYVTVVDHSLFFGSSSDDMVCCVKTETGVDRWTFFTEGPIRFAPTIYQGKVYCGADDGYVYCLDAQNGTLVWKYRPSPRGDLLLGNGRMISACPIRTSLVVQNGIVYFCAGVFPKEGCYICALNATDGTVVWKRTIGISPEGYLLLSGDRLFVPTGRTDPRVFRCSDGKMLGSFSHGRSGGTYALIVDDKIVSGPGYDKSGSDLLLAYNTNTTGLVASLRGNHVIVASRVSYLHTDNSLTALDRAAYFKASQKEVELRNRQQEITKKLKKINPKTNSDEFDRLINETVSLKDGIEAARKAQKASILWSVSCAYPYSLILAGNLLIAGGSGEVAAYDSTKGSILWTGKVTGRAYGLAASNGSLFVSTDRGSIHRFSPDAGATKWRFY